MEVEVAYFAAIVEGHPSLPLPLDAMRPYIAADAIFLEGEDGVKYNAKLFRRKVSEKTYVSSGWSTFELAHGIEEGDVLFCKLLPGPTLKIKVAEKNETKKRNRDEQTCPKKRVVQEMEDQQIQVDSDPDSDYESSTFEETKKVESITIQKAKKVESQRKEHHREENEDLLARIHGVKANIHNPFHVMELQKRNMTVKANVPMEFAMHLKAANGSNVKLEVKGDEHWDVNWISIPRFNGFGQGWIPFLERHKLKSGDHLLLEIIGASTIACHIFYLSQ